MSTARTFRRPTRTVALPGGDTAMVRVLTLAELRRVDERYAEVDDPAERATRATVQVVTEALVEADGTRTFPAASAEDLAQVAELFTLDQLDALFLAGVGRGKDAAKN